MNTFILYTYKTVDGKLDGTAYGAISDKDVLEQIGKSMQTNDPALGFMVLELQPVPV